VIPFVRSHREPPHTPEAVQRFSDAAQALRSAPGTPSLPEVTHAMSAAIEALPDVKDGDQLALQVSKQADAMAQQGPDGADALARTSLETALEAVGRCKSSLSQADHAKTVEVARKAIEKIEPGQRATVDVAFVEVANAMVVVSGGRAAAATNNELSQLVSRFAGEEPDSARRTGAQAISAMGEALQRLPRAPDDARRTTKELQKRAAELANAAPLDYSGQLKNALSLAVRSLDRSIASPAEQRLLDDAQVAVDAIRADRPLELQQAAAQDALRLVSDAITVSATSR
jgi:hypothetical protein